jgi:hypothetical protein
MMSIEVMSIQNCCEGKLADLFNRAIETIRDDIADRPTVDGERVVTLKIALRLQDEGQIDVVCSSKISVP